MTKPLRANTMILLAILMQFVYYFVCLILSQFIEIGDFLSMLLNVIIVFVIPAALYFVSTKQSIRKVLRLNPISAENIFLIIIFSILIQPFINFISGVSSLFFVNSVTQYLMDTEGISLFTLVLTMAVIPALGEELFFRGIIFSDYECFGSVAACILCGLMFGIMHMDAQQFLYAFIMGAIFCFMVYKTNSVFASVLSHFTINATQVIYSKLAFWALIKSGGTVSSTPAVVSLNTLVSFFLVFLLTLPFLYIIAKKFIRENSTGALSKAEVPVRKIINPPFAAIVIFYIITVFVSPII